MKNKSQVFLESFKKLKLTEAKEYSQAEADAYLKEHGKSPKGYHTIDGKSHKNDHSSVENHGYTPNSSRAGGGNTFYDPKTKNAYLKTRGGDGSTRISAKSNVSPEDFKKFNDDVMSTDSSEIKDYHTSFGAKAKRHGFKTVAASEKTNLHYTLDKAKSKE